MKLTINGRSVNVPDALTESPLLWVLREQLELTGTRYGCGVGVCGACTIHVDGVATRACQLTPAQVGTARVTTIEGLASADGLHPVQRAWIEHGVAQCGFCQSGQIMSASALLARTPAPTDGDIDAAMSGNLCRCGTYPRIRRAIRHASMREPSTDAATRGDETPEGDKR
ncbi:MAG: (2Fe-2S)-binding protein [Kofleriaceae bacterium]